MRKKKPSEKDTQPQDGAREIPIEDGSPEVAEASEASEASEMQALIDRLQRLQAEFENYKKRVTRETAEREERATDSLLLDVLPLYDAMKLAFGNYNRDQDAEGFVSGVERIFAQFEQVLSGVGIVSIEAVGQPFDPSVHEALLTVPSDKSKNQIVEEFSPGYVRNGRTLRASKVGVSQGPPQAKEEEA